MDSLLGKMLVSWFCFFLGGGAPFSPSGLQHKGCEKMLGSVDIEGSIWEMLG